MVEMLLLDADALGDERRRQLLEWCTGLGALPSGGLKDKVKLLLHTGQGEGSLPEMHTCSGELLVPPYASAERLREKLLYALDHRHDGFHIL